MLIEKYMDRYHFDEVHRIEVDKKPENIYPILKTLDFGKSRIIRLLFFLRGLPGEMLSMDAFVKNGFTLLGEKENEEIVLGMAGQPWKWNARPLRLSREEFLPFDEAGHIKVVWNFRLSGADRGKTSVSTETRIRCNDRKARKLFGLYWGLISRFSGVIRMCMLRLVKEEAEHAGRR